MHTPTYRLHVGDADRVSVTVVRSPQHSVRALTLTSGQRRLRLGTKGLDMMAPDSVVRSLQPHCRFALQPMLQGDLDMVPDVSAPIEEPRDVGMSEQLDYLRSTGEDDLLADLRLRYGDDVPADWRSTADQPRRWLDSMAAASEDTWRVLEPVWRRSQHVFAREIERVGVAGVRGSMAEVLDNLHPNVRFGSGWLVTNIPVDASYRLDGRPIVLVPTLGDPKFMTVNFERPDAIVLSYPIAGFGAQRSPTASGAGALDQVLGPVRADTLRATLQPTTMGSLAIELQIAPNTATYHCDHLERAGLVSRQRRRQSVVVSITERGRRLIELLSD